MANICLLRSSFNLIFSLQTIQMFILHVSSMFGEHKFPFNITFRLQTIQQFILHASSMLGNICFLRLVFDFTSSLQTLLKLHDWKIYVYLDYLSIKPSVCMRAPCLAIICFLRLVFDFTSSLQTLQKLHDWQTYVYVDYPFNLTVCLHASSMLGEHMLS